jgi:hypothetical protein
MRGHVDRKAGDGLGKVEAVIEIESTKVILVGFALAAVLTDDETGYRLQNFGRPVDGTDGELRSGDRTLAGGRRHADQVFSRVLDLGEIAERWGAVTTMSALVATSMTALTCTAAPAVTLTAAAPC